MSTREKSDSECAKEGCQRSNGGGYYCWGHEQANVIKELIARIWASIRSSK